MSETMTNDEGFQNVSVVLTAKLTFNIMCIKDINYDYGLQFDLSYHQFFRSLVHSYLLTFCNVKELTIGTWLTEVLCMLQIQGTLLPEVKRKYLTLELRVKRFNLYGLAGFLEASSHHIETLNIDISPKSITFTLLEESHCHFELSYLVEGDDIDVQNWILSVGISVKQCNCFGEVCDIKGNNVQDMFNQLRPHFYLDWLRNCYVAQDHLRV
ncbi:hypothetical protein H5410_023780, partial [Solanum commersonii]